MGDSDKWSRWSEYREVDVAVTSNAADGATIDINGTEILLKQFPEMPIMVGIYVEAEEEPIGVINIARSETVTLGGVEESISTELEDVKETLQDLSGTIEQLEERTNPPRKRDQ